MSAPKKRNAYAAIFDGKWVLRSSMKELSAEEVALRNKEL